MIVRLVSLNLLMTAWCDDQPGTVTAVAFAGGGFRAFAGAIGFTKAIYQTGLAEHVSTISSNSGGSWFSAMQAFSADFHGELTDADITAEALTADFLRGYLYRTSCTPRFSLHCLRHSARVTAYNLAIPDKLKSFLDGRLLALALDLGWQKYVSKIIGTSVADLPMAQSTRVNLTGPDLLFCTTLPTLSHMQNSEIAVLHAHTDSAPLPAHHLPLAYYLSGSDSGYFSPSKPLTNLHVGLQGDMIDRAPLQITNVPDVGKIASASSAVFGEHIPVVNAAVPGDNSELAVCTDVDDCNAPKYRFWDGGFVDNTGVALLVGNLQHKHGLDASLRIFLVDTTGFGTFDIFGRSTDTTSNVLSALMNPTGNSNRIFDYLPSKDSGDIIKIGSIKYLHISIHTVENTKFGIAGGQDVELILVLADEGFPKGITVSSDADVEAVASLSQEIYTSMLAPLRKLRATTASEEEASALSLAVDQSSSAVSLLLVLMFFFCT